MMSSVQYWYYSTKCNTRSTCMTYSGTAQQVGVHGLIKAVLGVQYVSKIGNRWFSTVQIVDLLNFQDYLDILRKKMEVLSLEFSINQYGECVLRVEISMQHAGHADSRLENCETRRDGAPEVPCSVPILPSTRQSALVFWNKKQEQLARRTSSVV